MERLQSYCGVYGVKRINSEINSSKSLFDNIATVYIYREKDEVLSYCKKIKAFQYKIKNFTNSLKVVA